MEATKLFVPIRHVWLLGLHTELSETMGDAFIQNTYFDRNIGFIRQSIERCRLY